MALPDAVKQAEKEAEEAAAAFDAAVDADAQDTEDISTLDGSDEQETGDGVEGADDQETDEGEDKGDALPDPPIETERSDAQAGVDWQQKYRTLEGKYNAEVPRMVRDLEFLRGQVEALSVRPSSEESSAEGSVAVEAGGGFKKYLTSDEIEEYDDDILGFQARLARGVAEELISKHLSGVIERVSAVEGQTEAQRGMSLWDAVERQYPGANEINETDPLWAEFLEQSDPLSGLTYLQIGEQAINSGNAGRIVDLLKLYQPLEADDGDEDSLDDDDNGEERAPAAGPPVKPSRSKGGTVVTKEKPKGNIRESDIQKFFTDVSTGKYAGKEDLRKKRETAIEEAVMEGRVVSG